MQAYWPYGDAEHIPLLLQLTLAQGLLFISQFLPVKSGGHKQKIIPAESMKQLPPLKQRLKGHFSSLISENYFF